MCLSWEAQLHGEGQGLAVARRPPRPALHSAVVSLPALKLHAHRFYWLLF